MFLRSGVSFFCFPHGFYSFRGFVCNDKTCRPATVTSLITAVSGRDRWDGLREPRFLHGTRNGHATSGNAFVFTAGASVCASYETSCCRLRPGSSEIIAFRTVSRFVHAVLLAAHVNKPSGEQAGQQHADDVANDPLSRRGRRVNQLP